ncbi:hypothetical protein GWO43_12975, partial [candidate division KSB1 bacterium]|nr:hypothetical protein [candidate division KSB1 bacterium]NIR71522.1 hypothetical protein [candidate division KSB1 bacterium]NIS24870.1 hypothetical protein [candidate division KSB1 bacterium]NIT71770.1 hypothetical protein [candidate division KSB1 bacterium]NIU25506.1 hypothetical protein [candidate division KSB1 bacterium]
MNNYWIPWSDRSEEFAPVLGLHKHHLFFPTRVEAFLKSECDLVILMRLDSDRGPIFGKINDFPTRDVSEKIQWMLHPKMNKKFTYLDRHGTDVNMKKSAELQEGEPKTVY